MSRFYASIRGNRGEATRCGTTTSGMTGHICGWDVGVEVMLHANSKGEDTVDIFATPGSSGSGRIILIQTLTKSEYDKMQWRDEMDRNLRSRGFVSR